MGGLKSGRIELDKYINNRIRAGMYYRETTVAGKTIFVQKKATSRIETKGRKRKAKCNPTAAAVQKVNDRNAERDLAIKLNANFVGGDYHLTLTYAGDTPTPSQAKRQLANFFQNVRRWAKKEGRELKYIAVTEYEHKRIHHHVVMSNIDQDIIEKYWKYGHVNFKLLDETGNYSRLAAYLLKETARTFREADNPCKRRYTCSRNIVTPVTKRELITSKEVSEEPKAIKGYYIDQDTIQYYDHAILEVECCEYIMVSLDKEPRLKRWSKGDKVKPEKYYKITEYEEQLRIEDVYDK